MNMWCGLEVVRHKFLTQILRCPLMKLGAVWWPEPGAMEKIEMLNALRFEPSSPAQSLFLHWYVRLVSGSVPCGLKSWMNNTCFRSCYGLGILPFWIWSRSGARQIPFFTSSIPALRPTQPRVQWVLCIFLLGKGTRTWRWPPTPSSAEVKKESHTFIPTLCQSWHVTGWPLPFSCSILQDVLERTTSCRKAGQDSTG
jgi:hypothetical protein